jgi:hypothetical protein
MNSLIEQLVTVLEKELETHRLLIAAAHDMNDAVKNNALSLIQAAARRCDDYTCSITMLEEKRLHLSDGICRKTIGKAPHASLLRVVDEVPVPWKKSIADLRAKLQAAIGDLSKINFANKVLLTESLSAIQKTFEMIATEQRTRLGGYKRQGIKDHSQPGRTYLNTLA